MKKLALFLTTTLISGAVLAAPCNYTADQEVVRSAENMMEIRKLPISADVNAPQTCGGNLMQLAILRGNTSNFIYLVEERNGDINQDVSLKGYEIEGAPDKVPFILFAARYCSDSSTMDYMIERGVNVRVKDSNGHDVFWYFEQNPVLRKSYLTKKGYNSLIPLSEQIAAEKRAFAEQQQ